MTTSCLQQCLCCLSIAFQVDIPYDLRYKGYSKAGGAMQRVRRREERILFLPVRAHGSSLQIKKIPQSGPAEL